MKRVDKHISKIFFAALLLSISLFLIMTLSSDFIEKLRFYLTHHIAMKSILYLYLLKIPQYIYQILPSAGILATLYTFGYLSANYEYMALKNAGLPLIRLALPLIIIAFSLFILSFILNEFVITKINYEMRIFRITQIDKRKPPPLYKDMYNLDINTTNGYALIIDKFDGKNYKMYNIKIIKINPLSQIEQRYDAKLAVWQQNKWILEDGSYRRFKDNKIYEYVGFKKMIAPFRDKPEFFTTIKKKADETDFIKYDHYIAKLKRLGLNTSEERVLYNFKFAYPFINVIVILIAIPFSIILVRTTMGANIGLAILFSFIYYIYLEFFKAMGVNGKIPPIIAAWFPNVSILLVSLYAIFKKN